MNYTFIELQKKYKIIIPQIQRDYAQGREDKDNENKIKSYDFVLKIIDVLITDNPSLNLDFVYGYTKEIAQKQSAFIPLDGQQRLTTLWLLHWYLSPKEEIEQDGIKLMSVTNDVKSYLKQFTYETRNSSKRFCEKLIDECLPVSNAIRSTIKDAHWFMASWLNDPTVVSMLNMLDAIQKQDFDKEKAWENLTKNRKITFDYIDIKSNEFKLTDELYIKMNSRGKPLTSFENFKAQFSEILSAKDTDYINERLDYEGAKVTFQKYFAFKIDGIWTDLFWDFSRQKDKDISSCFMNFFTYVARMCYFKDNTDKNASDFKNDFDIFKKKDNTIFLFSILDCFYKIGICQSEQVNIVSRNNFFESLFQQGKIDNTYQGQVRLFENKGINLFEKCLIEGEQFDNRNRIILYCLLFYMIKHNLSNVNDELRYYVRVIRNLLQATRQRKEIIYNTNVRINSFGKYWKLFNQLSEKSNIYKTLLDNLDNKETDISDDALSNEKEKAHIIVNNTSNQTIIQALFKLEEFKHFGGLIHNLNPPKNVDNLINWSEYVREIWSCSDNIIIASLISFGFGGFETKKCKLGERWFWGKGNAWNTILTGQSKTDENLSNPIISLLDKYKEKKVLNSTLTPEEILETIIQKFLDSMTEKNWQYYFCKYKKQFLSNSNYYYWHDDFENEILGSTGSNPLLSYHINPYVKTVSDLLDNTICQEGWCYARYSDKSCLVLCNDFYLYSEQDGWRIVTPEGQIISNELKRKYGINDKNVFKETDEKDRIEIAVDFCNDLTSECS
ncbi:hypothetical protein Barb7_00772 [Bacteroidales bacterium Barb7]|nr:hypothetical protein Barb7_00772 [Bacteroidales bacterium Barb7]